MTREPPEADLSPESLLGAYACGGFPMADPDTGHVHYFTCDPRCLIPLDDRFRITKSLARTVKARKFKLCVDTAFGAVIRACAVARDAENRPWISKVMIPAFEQLHELGFAHSIEAWLDGKLVGGSYGVALGAGFFGESMFCRPQLGGRDASKVCLVYLVEILRERGFHFLDSQYGNEHIYSFGGYDIPANEYSAMLEGAMQHPGKW
ncbi:MAG: leucyl/phenylalanyl-tRNA--protein transferase [Phycisphaerae bacterium]|nr:leucyl/phenylalanyl-tRNA--protein transferase [Phycisphaerae bacterium]